MSAETVVRLSIYLSALFLQTTLQISCGINRWELQCARQHKRDVDQAERNKRLMRWGVVAALA